MKKPRIHRQLNLLGLATLERKVGAVVTLADGQYRVDKIAIKMAYLTYVGPADKATESNAGLER